MIFTTKYLLLLSAIIWVGCKPITKDTSKIDAGSRSDTLVSIENDSTKLVFSLLGGEIVEFQDKFNKINPFSWKEASKDTSVNGKNSAVLQGQYMSFGRWSAPTAGELKMGMPINGEPVNNWWKLESSKSDYEILMSCEAPLDGYSIKRHVLLSPSSPLFKVTETTTNENSTGRITTIVQNFMLVPPFFEPSCIVNSNAKYGFNQLLGTLQPFDYEYIWPKAFIDTLMISTTDLSTYNSRFRYLSSHVFADSIAWFTVYNPKLKLILGYAWKSSEYPWIHFKNEVIYGKPLIHAIAFGTTGLSDKFSYENRLTTTFHNVRNFEFFDAKSSLTKSWYCFLLASPQGFEKTLEINFIDRLIIAKVLTTYGIKEIKLSL